MARQTSHLAGGIGGGRIDVKRQSRLQAGFEGNIKGMRVGLDGFLCGGAVRPMATAAFFGGIGRGRPRSGPGGVIGRVNEMTGAARTGLGRSLPQNIGDCRSHDRQIVFGVAHIDLGRMTFLTKRRYGGAEKLGAHQRRTVHGWPMGVMACQTGYVPGGHRAPDGVEQGKRDGFGRGWGRLRRRPGDADRVAATKQVGFDRDTHGAMTTQAKAGDDVTAARQRAGVLMGQMAGGAGTGVGNGFASEIFGVGKFLSQIMFVLNHALFIRVAVEAEGRLVIEFSHQEVLFDFVPMDFMARQARQGAILGQPSAIGNQCGGDGGIRWRDIDNVEEVAGAVRVDGVHIAMAREAESGITDGLFQEVFLLVAMNNMAGFAGD